MPLRPLLALLQRFDDAQTAAWQPLVDEDARAAEADRPAAGTSR